MTNKSTKSAFEGVTEGRRRNMKANRSRDTKPELTVRRMLHAIGYRFRTHYKALPGRPDIAFTARKKVVEIRGCFWHGHGCPQIGQLPKSRSDYWTIKINSNRDRDKRNEAAIKKAGWEVLVLWECRIRKDFDEVRSELTKFLGPVRVAQRKSTSLNRL